MDEIVIELRNIIRDFKLGSQTVHVLKGINLDIKKGEYVALMGPSGSGKSTLMNLLGCLDTPTSGSYKLAGRDVSQMKDNDLAEIRNKEIGFVFQTFNLIPRQTALQNVALPLVYAGEKKEARISQAKNILKRFLSNNFQGRLSFQCRAEMTDDEFIDLASQLNVRLEFGLQTIHKEEGRAVNRINNMKKVDSVMSKVLKENIECEVSLIFGLPCQTFKQTHGYAVIHSPR